MQFRRTAENLSAGNSAARIYPGRFRVQLSESSERAASREIMKWTAQRAAMGCSNDD